MTWSVPLPLLLLTLISCARPAADEYARQLEARVAKLEAQVARLQQSAGQSSAGAGSADPQLTTDRAAAQYCATQLASSLEEYRQDNARYPAMSGVVVPRACQGYRVAWTRLDRAHYRFQVSGQGSRELTSEAR